MTTDPSARAARHARARAPLLYLTVAVASTCGIVFELLAGAAATYLLGDSTTQFALVVGVFLTAMGVGAYLTRYVDDHLVRRFVECQLAVALVGGVATPALFVAFAFTSSLRLVLFAFVVVVGVFVGAELPLLLRILRRHATLREVVARAFTVDYAGALVGAIVFGVVALPRLGMIRTGFVFALLSAIAALASVSVFAPHAVWARGVRVRGVVIALLLGAGMIGSLRLTRAADEATFYDPVVFSEQTQYQRIVLTHGHGGINLFLDGNLQFAQIDEYRYHEALVHPAFAVAPSHARVLILGGGDGLAAREALRYDDVQQITLVDLDGEMTTLARTLPALRTLNADALSQPRVHVVNDDAMVWLAESPPSQWDVIVVDFPDPNTYSVGKLYTSRFYRLLQARLSPQGVIVVQSTSPLAAREAFWCIVSTVEAAGLSALPYHAPVPTFGEWGWVLATHAPITAPTHVRPGLRYVVDATLSAMFVFPPDMERLPVRVNRLNDQALVRYYDADWQRWLH